MSRRHKFVREGFSTLFCPLPKVTLALMSLGIYVGSFVEYPRGPN